MENLFNPSFLNYVRDCLKDSGNVSPDAILTDFDDFIASLKKVVENEESALSLFRYLRMAHIELCSCYKYMKESLMSDVALLYTLIWKAKAIIEVELEVVYLRIEQYGLLPEEKEANKDAPIFWSKEYNYADLMELILALHKSGALVFRNGQPASEAAIVRLFQKAFNLRIKNARDVKRNLKRRKITVTKFLDVLSANFVEVCAN
jgi:hypothetical protein